MVQAKVCKWDLQSAQSDSPHTLCFRIKAYMFGALQFQVNGPILYALWSPRDFFCLNEGSPAPGPAVHQRGGAECPGRVPEGPSTQRQQMQYYYTLT